MSGHWMNEWELGAADWGQAFRAKRSKRRPARGEVGGEDYLVSVCDTSAAARRADRWGTYMVAHPEARV